MSILFLKYFYDVTKINIIVSIFIGIITESVLGFIICFGIFGEIIGFVVYSHFKREQYYFYLNKGYTKTGLMRIL
jgi:hypothetical protein